MKSALFIAAGVLAVQAGLVSADDKSAGPFALSAGDLDAVSAGSSGGLIVDALAVGQVVSAGTSSTAGNLAHIDARPQVGYGLNGALGTSGLGIATATGEGASTSVSVSSTTSDEPVSSPFNAVIQRSVTQGPVSLGYSSSYQGVGLLMHNLNYKLNLLGLR